ncbi:MAG TPA: nuclear transport factor 2 family protein [Candidatus Angelobacter sp.]|nr:nuclear transport factor 2 family protein [Candidatus Angelobacter sp.]
MKAAIESDVSTLDGILHASYEVLSGPAGEARDWRRYRTLFADGARLMPVVAVAGEKPHVRQLTVEDYIRRVEPIFVVEDFWERETSRQTETFGRVAHVLSNYESLRDPNGPPFEHGANSMQLFYDDARWWIVSIMWNTSRSA